MDKSPDAFRTISEVADVLETPAHVLRFWESRFPQIRPVKRAGGRRYYRPSDVALLTGIKRLLHDEGLTIRGVQKILRDHGVRHVAGLSDDTVLLDDLLPAEDTDVALDEPVPEAGFIAIEDDEPEPPPKPVRHTPVDPPLPLFEAAAASAAPAPAKPALRLREDQQLAGLIRGLPKGHFDQNRAEVAALSARLAALRARLAERADGSAV
ncbi:MAG: MerR family transcriptional regulator [Tabrizicola sp.]|jgi:DNA-binding transcriptional MerR regulator|nr:MerR family transcriptional regulator [Tabrizicola sp.]